MNKWYVYGTKQGTTKACGEYLHEKESDWTLHDIKQGTPDIKEGDSIIIATGLYIGKPNKQILEYVKKNSQKIKACKSTLLVCGALEAQYKDSLEKSFQEDLKSFDSIIYGGYAYDFKHLNFLEKQMMKTVAKVSENENHIKHNNIDQLLEQNDA